MEYEKPLTENRRQKLNTVYAFLRDGKTHTKAEIMECCGLGDERICRDLIAEIGQRFPIVSVSSNKGYQMLPSQIPADAGELRELANHAIAELLSRQDEIGKRIEPLKNALAKVGA